jgi:hypothetical protein
VPETAGVSLILLGAAFLPLHAVIAPEKKQKKKQYNSKLAQQKRLRTTGVVPA